MISDVILHPIFIQGLGIIGAGLAILAMLQKDDNTLKKVAVLQATTFTLHFILLGAYGGATASGISACRTVTSFFTQSKSLSGFFIIIYIIFGLAVWEKWVDTLPIFASIFITLAFFHARGIKMRLLLLSATTLWLIHNTVVLSMGGMIAGSLVFCANSYRIYQMHKSQEKYG